ncbi:MAG TPA: hypothetical protein VJ277_02655, partial [Gemmatimonadales bacterium]|nr:hypothetical protein [Gemmatimonadales bacterium]
MNARLGSVTLLALLAGSRADAQVIAITNGTVYPVSSPKLDSATVILRDGRIAAIGRGIAIPPDATVVDAKGKWVTPGLIHAGSSLGIR